MYQRRWLGLLSDRQFRHLRTGSRCVAVFGEYDFDLSGIASRPHGAPGLSHQLYLFYQSSSNSALLGTNSDGQPRSRGRVPDYRRRRFHGSTPLPPSRSVDQVKRAIVLARLQAGSLEGTSVLPQRFFGDCDARGQPAGRALRCMCNLHCVKACNRRQTDSGRLGVGSLPPGACLQRSKTDPGFTPVF